MRPDAAQFLTEMLSIKVKDGVLAKVRTEQYMMNITAEYFACAGSSGSTNVKTIRKRKPSKSIK